MSYYVISHGVLVFSPYIAGEGLVVMETGGIYLWCQGQP